jgi:hypothetical protein
MATYTELHGLAGQNVLLERITVAIVIAADAILNEPEAAVNHANRLVWAKGAFNNPQNQAKPFLNALLASNNEVTVEAITGATDAAIQSKVDAAVDLFAGV